jgi:formylglycine-generating enzyme required for sulfatase activity
MPVLDPPDSSVDDAPLAFLSPTLNRFWERWRQAGFRVTTDERLRVEVLLQGLAVLGESVDRERLLGLLSPLIARSPQAQWQFARIFADCFADDPIYFEVQPGEGESEDDPEPEPELRLASKSDPFWTQKQTWWVGVAVAVCLLVFAVLQVRPDPHTVFSPAPASATPTPAASPSEGPSPDIPLATAPPSVPVVLPTTPPEDGPLRLSIRAETVPPPMTTYPYLLAMCLLVPIGLLGGAQWRAYRRQQNAAALEEIYQLPLILPGTTEFSFFRPPDARLPLRVRRASIATYRASNEQVDGQKSVEATLQAGGAPRFLLGTQRYRRAIVALIEHGGVHDHRVPYYIALLQRLDRLGADVRVFLLMDDGRLCQELSRRERGFQLSKTAPTTPLAAALRSFDRPQTSLLYFGGKKPLQQPDVMLVLDHQDWEQARQLVWETESGMRSPWQGTSSESRARWDAVEAILAPGGKPIFDRAPSYPLAVWKFNKNFWNIDRAEEVAESLRAAMPEPAFWWLCACATLQEVRWDLTLDLGHTLDTARRHPKSGPIVTEANLLALLGLPWFLGRGCSTLSPIPEPLRAALCSRLPVALRDKVVRRAEEILQQSLPEGHVPSVLKSHAEVQLCIELAVLRKLAGDAAGCRELVERLDASDQKHLLFNDPMLRTLSEIDVTALRGMVAQGRTRVGVVRTPAALLVVWLAVAAGLGGIGAALRPNWGHKVPQAAPIERRFVTPRRVNAGEVRGVNARPRVVLVNDTTRTLRLDLTLLPGSDPGFQLDAFSAQNLAPGAELALPLRLDTTRTRPGTPLRGSLRVLENGQALSELVITAGAPEKVRVTPKALDFRSGPLDAFGEGEITITNPSKTMADVRVSAPRGAGADHFVIGGSGGTEAALRQLAPGATEKLHVTYRRTNVGSHQAVLEFSEESEAGPFATVALSGTTFIKPVDPTTNPPQATNPPQTPTPKPVATATDPPRVTPSAEPTQDPRFVATLNGSSVRPPNQSQGVGSATITTSASKHTMRIQIDFNGLLGTTLSVGIHAPVKAPGITGRATQTPTLPQFPMGVQEGNFDQTFDMTQESSYSRGFLAANGGTPASAETVLFDAIKKGEAYVSINTSRFPGGELRGFLNQNPQPTATPFVVAGDKGKTSTTLMAAAAKARAAGFPALADYLYKMMTIPAGTFQMGDEEFRDAPPHKVTLTKPFVLGRTAVTVGMWKEYWTVTGKATNRAMPLLPNYPVWKTGKGWDSVLDHPIVNVSWEECTAYCTWASGVCGATLRLPTEAQREYAARGGLVGKKYPWGDDEPNDQLWWSKTSKDAGTASVDRASNIFVNRYGLVDLSGNVFEWCSDWYSDSYYGNSVAQTDPVGPPSGSRKVVRGGSWNDSYADFFRCANRFNGSPSYRSDVIGFRLSSGP